MTTPNLAPGPTRGDSLVQMEARHSYHELNNDPNTTDHPKKKRCTAKTMSCLLGITLLLALGAVVVMTLLFLNERKHNKTLTANSETNCPCGPFDFPASTTAKTNKIRGVNIGGFLVLEPNVSPSLFYQFLPSDRPAIDMRHFCSDLGPKEANKQLRKFWDEWVTREDIKFLADTGINTLRVPVGYWMFQDVPDEPYAGCTDGSLDQLMRLIDLATEFGLDVVIDLHAAKNSQNGFDNSAWTRDANFTDQPIPGTYVRTLNPQWHLNQTVVDETVEHLATIAKCFTCEPNVVGVSVLNEPFFLPADFMQVFYTTAFRKIKQIAPHWKIQASDDFLTDDQTWGGFWIDDEFVDGAIDTHIYHIFEPGLLMSSFAFHLNFACEHGDDINARQLTGTQLIIGEWSLATDDCAMWLLGLNQVSQYSELETPADCGVTKCPGSEGHPSPRPGLDGPDGKGNCPVDAIQSDGFLEAYGLRQLHSYNQAGQGWFYWNFKSELEERWSFIQSVKNGWLPKDFSNIDNSTLVLEACDEGATEPPEEELFDDEEI